MEHYTQVTADRGSINAQKIDTETKTGRNALPLATSYGPAKQTCHSPLPRAQTDGYCQLKYTAPLSKFASPAHSTNTSWPLRPQGRPKMLEQQ